MFDLVEPIQENGDVKWIYLSLQRWMNVVYYKQFQRFPLLYIHGISSGSRFAGLLCRVLPIQAQILSVYPRQREVMLARSDYDLDMRTRLLLDPMFANWFSFDFCYNVKTKNMKNHDLCPFQNNNSHFQSIPPTYFIFLKNDPWHPEALYRKTIMDIRQDAFHLGGLLLSHAQAIKLDVLPPIKVFSSYMQETFDLWSSKPYASRFFFEHLNSKLYKTNDRERLTCWCSKTDFTYFERFTNITDTWPKKRQEEYREYVSDIKKFKIPFCEEVCGDLLAYHAMLSRNIKSALDWVKEMDHLRRSLQIEEYITRPLRIWMYDKDTLITNVKYFSSQKVDWSSASKAYQMHSPEYYIQDYFQRLNVSNTLSRHNLQWSVNPLLADYFIVPSDLMFFYFDHQISNMTDAHFKNLHVKLNEDYFEKLLAKIRTILPFWNMSTRANQAGNNHIIAFPGGRNMGLLYEKTQHLLTNVIQLAFTGIRQDLLPAKTKPKYMYRNISVTYRHRYDVIIPQFTGVGLNTSIFENLDLLFKKKKRLFFFAGALSHSTSSQSARAQLFFLWQNIRERRQHKTMTQIQGRQFDTITVVNGHMKSDDYVESIHSAVFSICPEGFLPWSPRLYESIQLGAIPLILADNVVLPFERFIDWRSFTVKLNVSTVMNITNLVTRIGELREYVRQKLENAVPYVNAFRWPYSIIGANRSNEHAFLPEEDMDGSAKNVFHYISLELRCRRLEQLYGLTSKTFSVKSIEAQQQACQNHPTICPCHNERRSLAFREYI